MSPTEPTVNPHVAGLGRGMCSLTDGRRATIDGAITSTRRRLAHAAFALCRTTLAASAFLTWHAHSQDLSRPGSEFRDCPQCPAMVVLPAGQFSMGSPPINQGRPYAEGEFHTVTVGQPFALGKYEVTFDEWEACVRDRKCIALEDEGWGRGRRPAINVSWAQATDYTKWLSRKTGKNYRLPTEAEWEYAAQAGAGTARFFGIARDRVCEFANVYDLTAKAQHDFGWENLPCKDGYVETAPVGSFKSNAFGLHDMLGNVWEWTEDCVPTNWRGYTRDGSASYTGDCSERAYRGGSWLSHPPSYLLAGDRYKFFGARVNDLGFRVARSLP